MIDLTPAKNIARHSALMHAQARANREGKAMAVYVGPPDLPHATTATGFNPWFVRLATEPAPEGAELYSVVSPEPPKPYQPKTGQPCNCKPGVHRDNCPACEGTGWRIDFAAIRARRDNTGAMAL